MRQKTKKISLAKLTIVCIFFAYSIIACSSKSSMETILANNSCTAPCWQGIIPGETKREEVIDLLENIPCVEKASIREADNPFGNYDGAFYWNFLNQEKGIIYTRNGIVASIGLNELKKVSLEELIAEYGNPQTVIIGIGMGDNLYLSGVEFIYPGNEVKFQYLTHVNKERIITIAPTDFIDSVVFADQQFIEEGVQGEMNTGASLFEWQGYNEYQCK